ncbi:MAG TPA: DinB family protein [Bryobacteraceae bacterium]|nr:DinB family protein [Bryobacteraceae bacterium]
MNRLAGYIKFAPVLVLAASAFAQAPGGPPAKDIGDMFAYVNKQVLDMAKDFPAAKYDFRLKPEMRSFGAVIVHIASGNVYAAKAGRGEKVKWDELDPANYKTKEQAVALLEKSIADATATLKAATPESFHKSVEPWLSVIEHSGEHYGLLVAYYRANGSVPPASRKK